MPHSQNAPDRPPVDLAEYEARAAQRLTPNAAAYFLGGAGDERAMRGNAAAYARRQILPRMVRGGGGGDTRLTLLGMALDHPVLLAPVAYQRLAHGDGEIATAMAAAAQGGAMCLSMEASATVEDVAAIAPTWFQIYMRHDLSQTLHLARRAEAAGCAALVVTLDAPITAPRGRELRAGFRLPQGVAPVNLAHMAPPRFAPLEDGESAVFDRLMRIAPAWDDLARLIQDAPLPVLVKGVLHKADARMALEAGAAGIIVSNHGGRTLGAAPAPLDMLAGVAEVAAGAVPLLVDGGIRRGEDVLIALASGADAVMIGRPVIHGLAVDGARGVSHVIRLLRDELEAAMALSGVRTLAEITPDMLLPAP